MKKFGLKAIVAVLAMSSGVAMASAGTDLLLEVTDSNGTGTTFVDDLGISAVNPTGTITLGSAFDAWLATQTATDSFNFGAVGSNTTTVGDLTIDPANVFGSLNLPAGTSFNSIFAASASSLGTIVGSVGTSVANATPASFQSIFQGGQIYTINANAYGTNGTAIDLYTYNTSGVATLYGTANLVLSNIGNASAAATLVITPLVSSVPEPGTYALMAAGLLAVGAIVRRRSRA